MQRQDIPLIGKIIISVVVITITAVVVFALTPSEKESLWQERGKLEERLSNYHIQAEELRDKISELGQKWDEENSKLNDVNNRLDELYGF